MRVIKRIAVLTSGGDAPGMNAAIRAVTRCALAQDWDVLGVRRGYAGLVEGEVEPLTGRTVSNIMQRGGTLLGSARCPEFETEDTRRKALYWLQQNRVDALVVIGGNGSQTGALALAEMGVPVVGVASTIDNDLAGSEITIGVDTALNIALEAIDRLKTTASSHQRAFLIEVMGRKCGYLALMAGLAGGAEIVVIPERETTPEEVARQLRAAYERGKKHALAVVAEGAVHNGGKLDAWFREHSAQIGFDLRTTTLGHVQRGGTPTAFDRLLGTRLGAGAVAALMRGEQGVLVGLNEGRVATTPLKEVAGVRKVIDPELFRLASVLAQ
ncbi:MAG TPA: 6-phosphofructokinase [Edaphobacter sp.]|uniref:6-phosphofructokinase n=1 Tax=Edaphobacter sp. TaxID=1934404 RepID=UPI002C7B1B71|nr:6-phosphofructokinase [Edaphobacter sp.]HUZ95730.1 6-phosphofructokinase [Edaphobacter sp.]